MGKKISKQIQNRNQVQIYIPDKFFPKWERFLEIIENDNELKNLQDIRYKGSLVSLAVRLLINKYIKEQDLKSGNYTEPPKKVILEVEPELPPPAFPISLYDVEPQTKKNNYRARTTTSCLSNLSL